MITRESLNNLYLWAKETVFPIKKAPVVEGYSNKIVDYGWVKAVGKQVTIRKKLMVDTVYEIYQNDDILFSNYALFYPGTILKPHKDPDLLREPYKRIQIPLTIPDKDKCYMQWIDGDRVIWNEGVAKVNYVMHNLHEAFNLSDKSMEILFIDVKIDTEVEC